jgi:hypothetical protein
MNESQGDPAAVPPYPRSRRAGGVFKTAEGYRVVAYDLRASREDREARSGMPERRETEGYRRDWWRREEREER